MAVTSPRILTLIAALVTIKLFNMSNGNVLLTVLYNNLYERQNFCEYDFIPAYVILFENYVMGYCNKNDGCANRGQTADVIPRALASFQGTADTTGHNNIRCTYPQYCKNNVKKKTLSCYRFYNMRQMNATVKYAVISS